MLISALRVAPSVETNTLEQQVAAAGAASASVAVSCRSTATAGLTDTNNAPTLPLVTVFTEPLAGDEEKDARS